MWGGIEFMERRIWNGIYGKCRDCPVLEFSGVGRDAMGGKLWAILFLFALLDSLD